MIITDIDLLNLAYTFASQKHAEQKYNGKPYIIHPQQTYEILTLLKPKDINLRAAGLLHDVAEDCNVTKKTLKETFNEDIADLVFQVTKDENKDFPITSTRGLLLKEADEIANTSNLDIIEDPARKEKLFKKYASGFIHRGTNLSYWKLQETKK